MNKGAQDHEEIKLDSVVEILGHRDLNRKKTCPNFDVIGWWSTELMFDILAQKEEKVVQQNWFVLLLNWLKSLFKTKRGGNS